MLSMHNESADRASVLDNITDVKRSFAPGTGVKLLFYFL